MRVFKDAFGREWEFSINVAALKKIRAHLGKDLFADDASLLVLAGDVMLMIDVLWVLCKDRAQERGISEESFAEGFAGDALKRARDALVEEVVDFFPEERDRQAARKALLKMQEVRTKYLDAMLAKMENENYDEIIDRLVNESLSASTSAQVS